MKESQVRYLTKKSIHTSIPYDNTNSEIFLFITSLLSTTNNFPSLNSQFSIMMSSQTQRVKPTEIVLSIDLLICTR